MPFKQTCVNVAKHILFSSILILSLNLTSPVYGFENYEHVSLCNQVWDGGQISVGEGVSFTFGELCAIGGDYVSTPKEFDRLIKTQREDIFYIRDVLLRHSPSVFSMFVADRVFSRYLKLAQNNFTHFAIPSDRAIPPAEFQSLWDCGPSSVDCYLNDMRLPFALKAPGCHKKLLNLAVQLHIDKFSELRIVELTKSCKLSHIFYVRNS